jgi:hypothetical protein
MIGFTSVLLGLAAFTMLLWLATAVRLTAGTRTIRSLRDLPDPFRAGGLPLLSVVVAARDEAQTIESAVGSILAQTYPRLEVIVGNDRSSDGTGDVLDRMAQDDPRLKVVHNRFIPRGWLGKNHVLHLGAVKASGELILFSDADVILEPSTLARAVAYMEREELDHLVVAPDLRVPGYWGGALLAFFSFVFSMLVRPWLVRDPRSRAHVGIGAFNLVRTDSYRSVGGHSQLAMRPDDDMKLGKVLKEAGFRQELVFGEGMVAVDWYPGLRGMIRGLEKNSFAAVEYSLAAVLALGALTITLHVWPWLALITTSGLTWALNAGAVCGMLLAWLGSRGTPGVRLIYFPAFPLTSALLAFTLLRAAAITLHHGGIRWRGTFYPLVSLRANRV